jgi:hypothetical protein
LFASLPLKFASTGDQGCQMVYFRTKNPSLGKFGSVLLKRCWLILWSILLQFRIFYGRSIYFVVIWYIFSVLVFCTKKNLATLLEIFFINSRVSLLSVASPCLRTRVTRSVCENENVAQSVAQIVLGQN